MQRRHAHGPEGLHSESSSGSSSVKLFLPRNLSATSSGLASSLALTDGMNPSVNSTEEHGDPTWPSDQGWDHSNAAICCGIDSRPFQANRLANRLDWDWESPMILAQNSTTGCVGSDQDGDCKPNIMQADPIAAGLRHYNGLLSADIPSNLSHNAWGLLNAAGIRNGALGMESSSPCFPASSTPLYAGLASSGIVGFPTGIGSYGEARSPYEQQRHLLGLVGMDQRRYQDIVKREAYSTADFSARLGLNLGERAYFPLDDSTFGRFGKRLRPNSPGAQAPMCQAEGCKADLSVAKHYHRRHKVCELHSKAATVLIAGQTQRFCQQCSRFHVLSEFDEGKRSCRKRLADHNRRRRKPQPNAAASGSSTTESTAPRNEEEESVTGSNQNGNQAEGFTGSDQAQALVSAISLASSSPPLVQNGKTQPPVHSPSNEKETYQQYLQGGQSSPSLSLSTLGGGGIVTSEQQSSTQNFGGFDVPVSWLRTVSSKSNLIDAAPRPSMNMPHVVSDKGSPNTKFVETTGSSSSIMPALPHSLQNLMPLPASSDLITGSSNWVLKSIADQSNEQLTEFRSPKLDLHGKSEGQEVLSLLDVGTAREVEATESQIQQTLQAPLELLHHHFPSTVKMNGSTNGHSVNGNNDLKFPGLQGLNPFSRSIFNGRENIL